MYNNDFRLVIIKRIFKGLSEIYHKRAQITDFVIHYWIGKLIRYNYNFVPFTKKDVKQYKHIYEIINEKDKEWLENYWTEKHPNNRGGDKPIVVFLMCDYFENHKFPIRCKCDK